MEVDSGAARSIISQNEFEALSVAKHGKLKAPHTWTKQGLEVLGKVIVPVEFKGRNCKLPLLVVKSEGNALLGRY